MENNVDKNNILNNNFQQIKVNLKQKNNNTNLEKDPICSEYSSYSILNEKKVSTEEMKNVKKLPYLEKKKYNNNIFKEYFSTSKILSNKYSTGNLSFKNNKKGQLLSNSQTRKNNFNISNKEKYINNSSDKNRKTNISYKEKEKKNLFKSVTQKNKLNDKNEDISINQNKNVKIGTKLNIFKSEIQYPLNFSKDVPKSKTIFNTYNNLNEIDEDKLIKEIPNKNKSKNKNKIRELGQYYISSSTTNSNNKNIKQNKSNVDIINKRKNNKKEYSNNIGNNSISSVKNINYNSYSKNDNDNINAYNSCYNFSRKESRVKTYKNNDINIDFHNSINDYEYSNTIGNNSEGNKMTHLYNRINNVNIQENENGSNYINVIDNYEFNHNKKILKNKHLYNNEYNIDNFGDIKVNLNARRHVKGKKSEDLYGSLNNREMKFNNILDINKYIQYKKQLLDEFCHCLEDFIFINVKNNFDSFIFKLREYCKESYFNSLLLKRLQNKNINKNFYKDSSSLNKYLNRRPFYSSIIINNTNINDYRKNDDYILNDISREYLGRQSLNDFEKNNSLLKEGNPRLSENYRTGKSHDKFNYNYNTEMYNTYYINDRYDNYINKKRKKENLYVDNNLYIPKKLNTMKNLQNSKQKDINQYNSIVNSHNKQLLSPAHYTNKSLDIDNYLINNNSNTQDISYDNNYNIKKDIENGLLNQTKTIIPNNKKFNKNRSKINPIYKKKVKITQTKSNIIKNKLINNNNNNFKGLKYKLKEKIINPNIKQINNNLDKKKEYNLNLSNKKISNGNIREDMTITFNIKNNNDYPINNNFKEIKHLEELNNIGNGNNNIKNDEIINNKNDNGNFIQKSKNNYQENYNEIKNAINGNSSGINNNNSVHNGMSNGNVTIEEDSDESDGNIIREIIVKDVSTRDKRLNVFIKYIELPKYNKIKKNSSKHRSIIIFQTDSFTLETSYPKYNNRYNNYYYRNYGTSNDKSNKLKLHKILSSIIEEEEKSKAAESNNNSIIIEEDYKNGHYNQFFIQSLKYVTSFLQSILDDKKKDIFFQFFKILKRIKNDSFLKGLMNQKKMQNLNKFKDNNNEEENKNNTSGDIILYNINDSYNIDSNNFGPKSNDRKDISDIINKSLNEKEENNIKHIKESLDLDKNINNLDKNYSSANNSFAKTQDNLDINDNKNNLSIDNYNLNKKDNNKDINNNFDKNGTNKKNKKFQQIIKRIDEFMNYRLIEKYFKEWKKNKSIKKDIKLSDELNLNNESKEEDIFINIDYEKNVTISEACRGLSDVIFDFKLYLVKYCLKNKNE